MKIKMLTTKCGPDSASNWSEGQKRNVDIEEAKALVEAGVALNLEPFPSDVEKAVVKPAEKAVVVPAQKAVVKPAEVAKVQQGGVDLSKANWGK